MKQQLVSIVIVNWNCRNYLQDCIKSLSDISYPRFEVVVVDNASTDDSLKYLKQAKQKYAWLKVVKNKENLGFAGGNNTGYAASNGTYVVFLNNDTRVTPDFVTHMVRVLESDETIGGVQSRILLMDEPKRHDSVGAFFTSTGFLYHYGYYQKDLKRYRKQISLFTAKGACMMFRRSVIEEVGLFDPDYFAYFEETDFCHRVWLAGYTIRYAPEACIYHKIGATFRLQNSATMNYHSYKNRICSYMKNLGKLKLLQLMPLHIVLCIAVALLYAVQGNTAQAKAILQALVWNIQHIGSTFEKRRYVQGVLRKVPDADFMPLVSHNPPALYYYYLFAKALKGYPETSIQFSLKRA